MTVSWYIFRALPTSSATQRMGYSFGVVNRALACPGLDAERRVSVVLPERPAMGSQGTSGLISACWWDIYRPAVPWGLFLLEATRRGRAS
jgi:hypothetical protein